MVRQRVINTALLLLVLLGQMGSTCTGWQLTAAARAECCKAADHDCEGGHADDCCAASEGRQHGRAQSGFALGAVLVSRVVTYLQPPEILSASAVAPDRTLAHTGRIDTYLLLSVFLL